MNMGAGSEEAILKKIFVNKLKQNAVILGNLNIVNRYEFIVFLYSKQIYILRIVTSTYLLNR